MSDEVGRPSPSDDRSSPSLRGNSPGTMELLRRARSGDAGAVEDLLDRHRQTLVKVVERRMDRALGRRVDASDVVQDVLIEAHRRLAEYLRDPAMPFQLWLRHLARDRVIDMHRRHRAAQRRSIDREQPLDARVSGDDSAPGLAANLSDDELTPAAANIRRELQEQFFVALEGLDADDRDIILMRHFEQLGNSEVAELLGVSPAAAGMRHLRALRRLRATLGRSFEDEQSPTQPSDGPVDDD